MLPKGWTRKPLADCAKFVSGGTPNKDTEAYWGGDFPWITAKDMKQFRLGASGLTLTEAGKAQTRTVPAGSILVLTRGMTLLKDLPVCVTATDAAFNQDVKALLPFDGVDADYLACQLIASKNEILGLVDTAGHGTGRLDTDLLKDFEVVIAPRAEQKRVAKLLSVWDAAIATTERLLANSRMQKSALARTLLAPQRKGGSWKTYRLGSLFHERAETRRDNLPLLSITRDEGVIPRDDVGRKDTSNEDKSKYLRICPGDIGYNTMRMWQGVSALSSLEGIVSPAYTIVTPNEKIDGHYAAYLFKLPSMVFTFYRHSQGLVSDTWSLKFEHFKKISVAIPSRAEQERIVCVLTASDEVIASLNAQVDKLRAEKSALMQQLLTGRRRVRLPASPEVASV